MTRKGILSAGNWVIDRVKIVDRWPDQDTLAIIEEEEEGTGGAPYNVLVGLSRLKAPFPLEGLGLVGHDAGGNSILENCRAYGIDARQIQKITTHPTSYTDVMTVRSTKRRTFFHNHGANALLNPDHFDPTQTSCRILHLGYLLLLQSLDAADRQFGTQAARVLANFRKAGIKTSVDVVSDISDRFPRVVVPTLPHVDYLILNELESGLITGCATRQKESPDLLQIRAAAERLLAMGVRELVVIHFPEGALAKSRDGREWLKGSFELPEGFIQGTVGAGDAFCGGMLFGLHENWPIEECLQLAFCNAAACLEHPTSTLGVRPLPETLALGTQFRPRLLESLF